MIKSIKFELWFTKTKESGLEESLEGCSKSVGKKSQKYSSGAGQRSERQTWNLLTLDFSFFFFWDCFISYDYIFIFTLKNVYTCHTIESSYIKFRLIGIVKVRNPSYVIIERSIGGE